MLPNRKQLAPGVAALALVPFAVSPSCGQHRPPQAPAPERPPPGPTDPILAGALDGDWQWSHVVEEDGVRRVEHERWQLELDGPKVTGSYHREVTFLSLDGTPFDCSQTLSYQLSTRYRLRGVAHATHVILEETDYATEKSPCERGYRKLGRYEGFLRGGGLLLIWKGGSQTLTRAPKDADPPPLAEEVADLEGAWAWHNSTSTSRYGEIRVEREDWELTENPPGRVLGTYLRVVTLYDANGRPYECSGTTHYTYTDRYTVHGIHEKGKLVITEIGVDAETHPCLDHHQRHLDQARGQIRGDYLELVWRGGHTQVLHRPVK